MFYPPLLLHHDPPQRHNPLVERYSVRTHPQHHCYCLLWRMKERKNPRHRLCVAVWRMVGLWVLRRVKVENPRHYSLVAVWRMVVLKAVQAVWRIAEADSAPTYP